MSWNHSSIARTRHKLTTLKLILNEIFIKLPAGKKKKLTCFQEFKYCHLTFTKYLNCG
jgi:hypothetical protein